MLDKLNLLTPPHVAGNILQNQAYPDFMRHPIRTLTGRSFVDNWKSGTLTIGKDHFTNVLRDEKTISSPKTYVMLTQKRTGYYQ